MKLLIAGGGTGGHLYPGLAVAAEFTRLSPGNKAEFIGTKNGIEARVLPETGYSLKYISIGGFLGKQAWQKMLFPFNFLGATGQSLFHLISERPDAVLGTGGYVSAPPVLAAWLLRIPVSLLALDVMPSKAVRFLTRFAGEIYGGFPECSQYLSKNAKVVFTGNPIRREVGEISKEQGIKEFGLEPGKKTILIFGGSQGAHSINLAVLDSLTHLNQAGHFKDIQIIFQTGQKDLGLVTVNCQSSKASIKVLAYIDKMPYAMAAADLVISRSGAGVSETLACGLPSILIPLPHAASNHQEYNARSLEKAGAAEMILDSELNGQVLSQRIIGILFNPEKYGQMSKAARSLARPGAAREIAEKIFKLSQ
jgi:UDP-N-acetylglucosamine--N-acetylmuramyl-(pentapeptide) pyrophosphoryl-undecaprenol N-acetylglucosamine transferase